MQENKLQYPDTNEGNIALYSELSRIESSTNNMVKYADQRTQLLILLSKRGLSVEPMAKSESVMKPIPSPSSGESQDAFISRCMSALSGEDKPHEQRLAICFSRWREGKK